MHSNRRHIPRAFSRQKTRLELKEQQGPRKTVTAELLSAIALFGTLCYTVMRFAGHAYRDTYLSAFGFDSMALPWPSDELIYLGFSTQADFLIELMVILGASALVLGILIVGFKAAAARIRKKAVSDGSRRVATQGKSNLVTNDVLLLFSVGVGIIFIVYLSLIPLVVLGRAERSAIKRADREIASIKAWDVAAMRKQGLRFVNIRRSPQSGAAMDEFGIAISCTDKYCDLYSAVGPIHARTVPLDNVSSWSVLPWASVPSSQIPKAQPPSKDDEHAARR